MELILSSALKNVIPRDAVLSFTLFNIRLHNINHNFPEHLDSMVCTDDVTVWGAYKYSLLAVNAVQQFFNSIHQWATKCNFKISEDKTECAVFTSRCLFKNFQPALSINGNSLNFNPTSLVYTKDSKLLWELHINYIQGQYTKVK